MKRYLLLSVFAVALIACREKHVTSTNDTGNTSSSGSVVVSGSASQQVDSTKLSRMVVSFISKGAGIDEATKANLDKWLSKHADVNCTKIAWGREGEVDYAFDLKSKNSVGQKEVVKDVRALIGTNDNVLIQEWAVPHEGRVHEGDPAEAPALAATPLVVSFISKGEGIDLVTKEKFDEWLSNRPEYGYTITQKGREGEMKYCFVMRDKKPEMYSSFVMDVKNYLAGKELVLVTENEVCQHVHLVGTPVVEQAPVVAADTSIARLVVSFISKGEGIDDKTKEEFDKWLAMRERFTYSVTPWGREGEVNYCVRMTNISVREQEIFVKEVRGFLVDKELVLISEYAKCK